MPVMRWLLICVLVFLPGPALAATSVTQHGFTVTFADDETVGQYANGDYYVVGPVTISDIENTYHGTPYDDNDPGDGYDGCMVNPDPDPSGNGYNQGYDDDSTKEAPYSAALDLRDTLPFTLNPSSGQKSSLICSASILDNSACVGSGDPFPCCTGDGTGDCTETGYAANGRPRLHALMVLTVVNSAPSSGAFRPPYVGTADTSYNTSQVNYDLLPDLDAPTNAISLADAEEQVEMPQIDHVHEYNARTIHARLNFPNGAYGAGFAHGWGDAILTSFLSETDLGGSKTDLVNYIVQLGIDLYGIIQAGGYWPANGGHQVGRLTPILYAGKLLNNSGMLGLATTYTVNANQGTGQLFQEWGNVVYICDDTTLGNYDSDQPRVSIDVGTVTHGSGCLGYTEFGGKILENWSTTTWANTISACSGSWGASYQDENGINVPWQILTLRMLDLEDEFGSQAYIDYAENRYFGAENTFTEIDKYGDGTYGGNAAFHQDMWSDFASSCDDGACMGSASATAHRCIIGGSPINVGGGLLLDLGD